MDSMDRAVVAFESDPWPNTLRVGVKTGVSAWEFQEVREWGHDPSLVIQDGVLHVAYVNSNISAGVPDPQVEYATASSYDGSWSIEVVDTRTPGGGPSLAFDDVGTPHVLYRVSGNTVIHAWHENGSWLKEDVTKGPNAGAFVDVAADSQGDLHVAYSLSARGNSNYFDLNYAHYDGSAWSVEAVVDDCGWGAGIAVDSQDQPHATCSGQGGLYHHVKTNGSWETTVVDDGSKELRSPEDLRRSETSIEIDAQDRPHIGYAYGDDPWSNYDLTTPGRPHYATQLGDGSWWTSVVEHVDRDNGDGISLALDSSGRPHVAYQVTERVNAWSCSHPLNSCFHLRYATPVQSALASLGE